MIERVRQPGGIVADRDHGPAPAPSRHVPGGSLAVPARQSTRNTEYQRAYRARQRALHPPVPRQEISEATRERMRVAALARHARERGL